MVDGFAAPLWVCIAIYASDTFTRARKLGCAPRSKAQPSCEGFTDHLAAAVGRLDARA